jgi:hypothetical protein
MCDTCQTCDSMKIVSYNCESQKNLLLTLTRYGHVFQQAFMGHALSIQGLPSEGQGCPSNLRPSNKSKTLNKGYGI